MGTVEKIALTVFMGEDNEPRGFLYFNKNRDRIVYTVAKADEEDIIELLNCKEVKIKKVEEKKPELPEEKK